MSPAPDQDRWAKPAPTMRLLLAITPVKLANQGFRRRLKDSKNQASRVSVVEIMSLKWIKLATLLINQLIAQLSPARTAVRLSQQKAAMAGISDQGARDQPARQGKSWWGMMKAVKVRSIDQEEEMPTILISRMASIISFKNLSIIKALQISPQA